MSSPLSPLFNQLTALETQLLSSQIGILTTTGTEQASAANSLLSNARLIREQLARESMDSNHKLSEAVLMVVMYIEKVESTARLLALADTCIGKIRARMRVNGIPINVPSDEVPVLSDAGEIDQDEPAGSA